MFCGFVSCHPEISAQLHGYGAAADVDSVAARTSTKMITGPLFQKTSAISITFVATVALQVCVGPVALKVIQEVLVCPSSARKNGNHVHQIISAPFLQEGDANPHGVRSPLRALSSNSARPPWLTLVLHDAGGSRRSRKDHHSVQAQAGRDRDYYPYDR